MRWGGVWSHQLMLPVQLSPPRFCKELSRPTSDDIEVKVCTDEGVFNEDIAHLYSMKCLCTVEKTWVAGVVCTCTLDFNTHIYMYQAAKLYSC